MSFPADFQLQTPKPGQPRRTSSKAVVSLTLALASIVFGLLTAIPAIVLGVLAQKEIRRGGGAITGGGLASGGIALGVLGCFWGLCVVGMLPLVLSQRELRSRIASQNNLRAIMIGLHNYHDTMAALPQGGSPDPEHGLQISWRARATAFIDGKMELFDRIQWNEPWDSPNNRPLHSQMIPAFRSPARPKTDFNTVYLGVGNAKPLEMGSTVFGNGSESTRLSDITDGTSNTIAVVEADAELATEWMRPRDLDFNPAEPKAGLGNLRGKNFIVVMADGSVRTISNQVDDETLRRLMIRDDGQRVDYDGF